MRAGLRGFAATPLGRALRGALRRTPRLERAARGFLGAPAFASGSAPSWPPSWPLRLPAGTDEPELYAWLASARLDGAPAREMEGYLRADFRRFVHTLALVPEGEGRLLELGANPYFTTLLLRRFRRFELTLANFFGHAGASGSQIVDVADPAGGRAERVVLRYDHFNTELDAFPYAEGSFDVVVYCEVIEHMQNDPLHCLAEIHRALRPGGVLVLSTPNVARLENVLRLVAGQNLYDPYSGYGPYGRHNREYNRHEVVALLRHAGFEPDQHFTADVHPIAPAFEVARVRPLVEARGADLGQYIFARARRIERAAGPLRKPSWLYRSYPEGELCD